MFTIALNFLQEKLMWNIAFKIKAIENALHRFVTSFTHAFSSHSFVSIIVILILSASNQFNLSFVLRETDELGFEKYFSGFLENSGNSRKGRYMNGIRQLMELSSLRRFL